MATGKAEIEVNMTGTAVRAIALEHAAIVSVEGEQAAVTVERAEAFYKFLTSESETANYDPDSVTQCTCVACEMREELRKKLFGE